MEPHPPLFKSTFPPLKEAQQHKGDDDDDDQKLDLITATLPVNSDWGFVPLVNYQGFWLGKSIFPAVMAARDHFKARPTDILVATPAKCGTTWLKSLVFAAHSRSTYPLSQHPLLTMNPHECFHSIEWSKGPDVDAAPSPRLLASHIPYPLLPESVLASGCRIVYICRDPKDALVSLWNFRKAAPPPGMQGVETIPPLSKAFERYCSGVSWNGPFWDHYLGYWNESVRSPGRLLFFKYEEMMEEPAAHLKRLAEFIGCPFTEEEEGRGAAEEIVRLCSFENLSGLEVNKSGIGYMVPGGVKFSSFFRKGKVGDWVNHLSPEMARKLDEITQEKLYGSGLTIPGVGSIDANTNG